MKKFLSLVEKAIQRDRRHLRNFLSLFKTITCCQQTAMASLIQLETSCLTKWKWSQSIYKKKITVTQQGLMKYYVKLIKIFLKYLWWMTASSTTWHQVVSWSILISKATIVSMAKKQSTRSRRDSRSLRSSHSIS